MRSKNPAKTKSARKPALFGCIVLIAIALGLHVHNAYISTDSGDTLRMAGVSYALTIATTDADHDKGLSGRPGIGNREAMLFVFDEPARQCFWMKDMQFNIDIVWLNADKEVVRIVHNLSPDTYPEEYCVDDAQYVVEVAAGQAKERGISRGETLDF